MIDERDLIRHLEEGGDDLWNAPPPPKLDLAAITGVANPRSARVATETVESEPAAAAAANSPHLEPPRLDPPVVRSPAPAPQTQARRRWWRPEPARSFGLIAAGGLACVALGLGIGAIVFSGNGGSEVVAPAPQPQPQQQVSLVRLDDAPEGAAAVASVFASKNGDTIDVRVSGLPPLPPGKFYELWALGDEGRMVSLGNISVDVDGNGQASMALPVSLAQFPVLDISLEPADGNPKHSGSSLLRSPA